MKNYFLLMATVLLLFDVVFVKSVEFEVTPIQTHFIGCLEAKGRLIVYGTGGVFWVSSDKGDSWEKKIIYPFGTIRKIVSQNDTLWGIMDEGIILVSTDLGLNWLHYKIDLDDNDFFANLVVHSGHIFIRTKNKILKFDKKMNLIDSIEDNSLSLVKNNFFAWGSFKGPALDRYLNSEMFRTPSFLIANIGNPLPGSKNIHHFLAIDYNLDTIRFIDVDSIVLKRDLDFRPGHIYSVDTLNNSLLITLGSHPPVLYQTDYALKSWKYFFNDTLLVKNDSFLKRVSFGSYFFSRKDLYVGFYNATSEYLYKGYFFKNSSPRNFGVCAYSHNSEKEFFKIKGKLFENKYYVYPIGDHLSDRLLMALEFLPERFVQIDSTFIFIGPFKTIVRVDDEFSKWELISSLNSQPFKILNDSVFIFVNTFSQSFDIDCSFDGGDSFLPTILGLNKELQITYIVDSLSNVIDSIITTRKVSYLPSFKSLPTFYVDTTGTGFFIGSFGNVDFRGYPTCGITLDFFRTIKFIEINTSSSVDGSSNVFFWDNKLCFYLSAIYQDTMRTYLYYVFPNELSYSIDTLTAYYLNSAVKFVQPHYVWTSGNKWFVFSTIQDSSMLGEKRACIYETDHTFNLKIPKFIIGDNLDFLQFYEINPDSILFVTSYPLSLFLFDKKNAQLLKLFSSDSLNQLWLVDLSGNLFLFTDQGLLENSNRSDLTQWQEGKWDYGKPNFESVIFKGNVAIAGLSDSLRPFNYYKITLKKDTTTSVEDSQIDARYYTTHFYATEPYPLPAHNIVKSKIYTDGSFDLHQAIDGVYDVMGNRVEGKQRITIKELGKATAELTWNCSGIPSGIYFIVVRHNGQADTIPVIVE